MTTSRTFSPIAALVSRGRSRRVDPAQIDAVVHVGQRAGPVPGRLQRVDHALRDSHDAVRTGPQRREIERLVDLELQPVPAAQRFTAAVDRADHVRDSGKRRRDAAQDVVLVAVRVNELDLVPLEEPREEANDSERRVPMLVHHRDRDAQRAQLGRQPSVIEQHGADLHVRTGGQIRRQCRHLHLGAGPQIGGHDVADADRCRSSSSARSGAHGRTSSDRSGASARRCSRPTSG